jgi:hypothetical protein
VGELQVMGRGSSKEVARSHIVLSILLPNCYDLDLEFPPKGLVPNP